MPRGLPSALRRVLDDLRTAATMPRVKIVLSRGREDEEATLRRFRRPHPRYRIVSAKAVGVALLALEDFEDVEGYLASLRTTRRGARRASALGYTVELFDPDDRRADLLAIHVSLPERQGRPIDADYLDPDAVLRRGPDVEYVGVVHQGAVVAYSRMDYLGDIAAMGRVMGHGDHLEAGVMFLLAAGIVERVKSARPGVRYLFYDTFFGAPSGLRAFKAHLGFRPHYVRWVREPSRPSSPPGARRVCHVTTVHPVDDHRILHKECASLSKAGYDVTLIAPHRHDVVIGGIRVVALHAPARFRLERMLHRPWAAYRAALAVDAELYHFHDPEFLPYGVRLARAGKRVVYDAHEDVPVQMAHKDWIPAPARGVLGAAFARFEAACAARVDAVVSPSRPALNRLRPRQPRALLVANYPRLETSGPSPAWEDRPRAACYVGGITRVRGARELVDAMADVDAELYLAGAMSPPALRHELERSAGWGRVRYLGLVEHERVADVLARARVGVVPLHPTAGYREALPVKLFEYLAAGLPVVSTDVPRWREILDRHDCGICVPHGSPRLLAAAIAELLDDDERARAMGERGRRAVEAHYSWRTQAQVLVDLYDELLA